jgi:hypothetical protein
MRHIVKIHTTIRAAETADVFEMIFVDIGGSQIGLDDILPADILKIADREKAFGIHFKRHAGRAIC